MKKIFISSHRVLIGEICIIIHISSIVLTLTDLDDIVQVHKTGKVQLISPNYNLFKHYLALLATPFDYYDLSYISRKYWRDNTPISTHFYLNPRRFVAKLLKEIIDELQPKLEQYNAQK